MIDTGMIKWYAERYIDTDVVWVVAAKKAIKNMDRDSLKRLLNSAYGLSPTQVDYMTMRLIWQELQRRNKEEKKMENKKYYNGSVAVTTWRSRKPFEGDCVTSNHKTDLITFREGVFFGMVVDSNRSTAEALSVDTEKRYTKEEITELITSAWDKGEYAGDQTDISWLFNPDPEGFTGTVDLSTVILRDPGGIGRGLDRYFKPQVHARCRVRIVDGTFFEKLDGSSKLADILKTHKGVFSTKIDIEKYIKDKWRVGDFGTDASYFRLDIKED